MILSTSSGVGKSDILLDRANDLAAFVRRGVQDGLSFDQVERGILGMVLDLGFAAVNLFLNAQGDGDLGATVEKLKAGGYRLRNEIVIGNGGKQVLVEDPSGNPIELFEPA